jgi:hypothetical protein
LSSWLKVTGTPGNSRFRISPTRCTCFGLTIDQSKATATALTPDFFRYLAAATTSGSFSFSISLPMASMRPRTSQVRLRGM